MPPLQPQPNSNPTPEAPQPSPVNPVQMGTPASSGFLHGVPKWIKILMAFLAAVVVVFAIVVVVVVGSSSKAMRKVSDQFVNDMQAGDSAGAYSLTSDSFKSVTSQDRLDAIVQQIKPAVQGQEKMTAQAGYKSSNSASTNVLVYTIPTDKGDHYVKLELQNIDGKWQVVNVRYSPTALKPDQE